MENTEFAQALRRHHALRVRELAAAGTEMPDGQEAIMLLTSSSDDVDAADFRYRTPSALENTLRELHKAGVDLNVEINGEPASHYLTRHMMTEQAEMYFADPSATLHGDDRSEPVRKLAAFARGGVDFFGRDAQGRGFMALGMDLLRANAELRHPETMSPGYEPSHAWDKPAFSEVVDGAWRDLSFVKREAQRHAPAMKQTITSKTRCRSTEKVQDGMEI